ncbi:MAG: hypothetical protein EON60_13515 [Alphaproteobacteria bacterium]|nr:MAG: hypothetical protein EON60_13515 [Alphaproteobacteria bacterium]
MTFNTKQLNSVWKLEEIVGYRFSNRQLALHSLTLPTGKSSEDNKNFQYLEFVGDRVYNLCVVAEVSERFLKPMSPGTLNNKAFPLLSNQYQATFARERGILELVLKNGKSSKPPKESYKQAADILEAIYGAIFIDSEHNFSTVFASHMRLVKMAPVSQQLAANPVLQQPQTAAP